MKTSSLTRVSATVLPAILLSAFLGLAAQSARAASATWNALPTSGNWITTVGVNNWSTGDGTFPGQASSSGTADVATFSNASSITLVTNNVGFSIGGILFDTANASAYTIYTSGGTWRINNGANSFIRINSTVVNPQVINGALRMASGGPCTVTSDSTTPTATLTIANGMSVNNSGGGALLILTGQNTGPNIMATFTEQTPATIFGSLTKSGAGTWILTGNSTYHSNTLISGGILMLIGNGAIPNSSNIWINSGTLCVSNAMVNPNNMVVTNGGSLLLTNTFFRTPLTIGNLTASNATFHLGVNGSTPYTNILVTNNINLGVNLTIGVDQIAGVVAPTIFNLISYAGTDPDPANINVTTPGGYLAGTPTVDTVNKLVQVQITPTAPPVAITWQGSVSSGDWDTTTPNWTNSAGAPVTYNQNDLVTFDDTALTTVVNLTTILSPGTFTNDTAGTYTFGGVGKISGATSLVKKGTGTLIFTNAANNDYNGGTTISGTLQVGNGSTLGSIPASGSVANNGALIFNRSDAISVGGVISGSGTVTQNGAGTLTLSGANTYAGTTTINAGKVVANNGSGTTLSSSLGAIPGGAVTVVAGATLDVENSTANSIAFTNNNTFTAKQFNVAGAGVDGNGVIVNNGTVNQQSAFQNISLTGDATFGGLARWDMRGNASIIPQLNLNGFTLTKTNPMQISLVNVAANAGNIDLREGVLSFEGSSAVNGPDGSQGTITVRPAGAFGHFRTWGGAISRPIVLAGGSITNLSTSGGASTNDSPITLSANSTIVHATGSDLYLRGQISGGFGVTKLLSGTTLLAGTNIYTGNTVVGAGTLALTGTGSISNTASITISNGATLSASGRTDGTLWLSAGQTLKGAGSVAGTLTLGSGSTVAPGFSAGALADTGAVVLQGGATNLMEVIGVSNATAGVGYDTLTASGAVTVQSTSGNPFLVKLVSLDGTGAAGAVTNFDNTVNYAWTMVSGSSISGYSADKFAVDDSAFVNALGGAHFVVKSTSTALQVALNHAPVANATTFNRASGTTFKILVANLATNWSDPDGDAVTLSSVAALSGNGFTVFTDGTNIFYSGADSQNDSFTYTISDGFQTASGTVNITAVAPPPAPANATLIVPGGGGIPTITFAGIPGRTNVVQASSNLVDWVNISTNVAGTNGLWQVTDPDAPNFVNRFYRSYQPYP